MTRRMLVMSASVGAGHLRAAQAVELALRQLAPTPDRIPILSVTERAINFKRRDAPITYDRLGGQMQ